MNLLPYFVHFKKLEILDQAKYFLKPVGITRTNGPLQAKAEIGPIPVMPMANASFFNF
jgi:hypothetical protein